MAMRLRVLIAFALLALALVVAPAAPAKRHRLHHPSPATVVRDCTADDDLDHVYWAGELWRAGRLLPKDVSDYSACTDTIDAALLAGPTFGVRPHFTYVLVACGGTRYSARLLLGRRLLGTGTRGPCGRRHAYLRIRTPTATRALARRHRLVRVVLDRDGFTMSFVARLRRIS